MGVSKIINSKKLIIYPITKEVSSHLEPPTPASKYNIPQWFRNMPKYSDGGGKFLFNGASNLSVKSCLPVVDGFTSGYTINLHCDIQVVRENGQTTIHGAFTEEGIQSPINARNSNGQKSCGWDNLEGYDNLEFNWFPSWSIRTPKGYSSIFMHPINRIDLPFYTLGGVIDTDEWGEAGNHPFLLKKGWEGIIPKNTPIIQVIPFKRDNWQSTVDHDMYPEYRKQIGRRNSYLKDYYKKFLWSSKNYK